jgi:tRNA pseudouridine38-40 synthase
MRYALGLEYDGGAFSGWQRLSAAGTPEPPEHPTVQGALEAALASVADHPVTTVCAGRTDAGVHARCQVVHFDSDAERMPRAWLLGVTARLPPAASVRWCVPVPDGFSARFSAVARRYRYRLLDRASRPGLERQYLAWERQPLDVAAMHEAVQALLGEHDFSAFRSAQCQATHARRCLTAASVQRVGEEVHIGIEGNAFLHHMVRNIVGSLLPVGRGEQPGSWLAGVLAGRDRTRAGATAPACGLTLLGPRYLRQWPLPDEVLVP